MQTSNQAAQHIKPKFELGQIVWVKTDVDQAPCIVTAIIFTVDGGLLYEVVAGRTKAQHYEAEIHHEPNQLLQLGINQTRTDNER